MFIPLQSCSNSLIGEKLENSFDNSLISENTSQSKDQNKLNEIKKIKSSKKVDKKENANNKASLIKENSISNKDRFPKKTINNVVFTPQPYRIILKLSAANPSAPAETVTNALIKAGIQFEVEKIERYDEASHTNESYFKRKEF
tara:strand:+ start:128 stop:559 length:432 start_codon:yes stop_codon:yes gene_type:complete